MIGLSATYEREPCGCVQVDEGRVFTVFPCPAHGFDDMPPKPEHCPACNDDGKPCALCGCFPVQP